MSRYYTGNFRLIMLLAPQGEYVSTFELFSKRQKRLRGDMPDVYIYDDIPEKLRVQIVHILKDTYGDDTGFRTKWSAQAFDFIHKALCKEYGVFSLKKHCRDDKEAVLDYFLNCDDYEHCLDVVEISFRTIENYVAKYQYQFKQDTSATQTALDAIEELNVRFKEHGVGYEFSSGELIRIDSQILHSEAVKPTLTLLRGNEIYAGSNDEFLKAHEHYRHKRNKECLVDCLKSFESLMKAICSDMGWEYKQSDNAKKLISICLEKKLIPEYLQNQFSSLRILLESGIPTVRNKEGGHGQGAEISSVPDHFSAYALHLTASNLLFLAQCHELTSKGSGH